MKKSGFITLVELFLVLFVLGIVVIALMGVISQNKKSANAPKCQITSVNPKVNFGELSFGDIKEIEYDGCQYVYFYLGHASMGAHKGNCTNPIHAYNIEKK
jgi:uncharacterized secreted protein with C-terminal beta-propeller domain